MRSKIRLFTILSFTLLAQNALATPSSTTGRLDGKFPSPWIQIRHSSDWVSWRVKQTTGDKVVVARFLKNTGEAQPSVSGDFVASRNAKLKKIGISDWKALTVKPISIAFHSGESVKATQLDGTYLSPSKKIFCFVERQARTRDRILQFTSTEPMSRACDWNELAKRLDSISVNYAQSKKI